MRLDPHIPTDQVAEGVAFTLLGRPKEAIPALKRWLAHHPDDFWVHTYLSVDYMELGNDKLARAEAAEVLRFNPEFTVDIIFPTVSLRHRALPAEIDRFRADLRQAGLK